MNCDVCGRDNPERLTFCQDCGKRLRVPTGSGATPTPPHGMAAQAGPGGQGQARPSTHPAEAVSVASAPPAAPAASLPSTPAAAGPGNAAEGLMVPRFDVEPIMAGVATRSDAPPSFARRASRPEAPVFAFGFEEARAQPTPPPQPAQSAPPASMQPLTNGAICTHCGGTNPRTHRFCTTCGGTLGGSTGSMGVATGVGQVRAHDGAASALAPVAPLPAQPTTPHMEPLSGPSPIPSTPAGPVYAGAAWSSAVAEAPVADPPTDQDPPQLVGAPVVAIASQPPLTAATVTCARCQGQCSAAARYCKYCGSLLEAQSESPRAASSGSQPPPGWVAAEPPPQASPGAAAGPGPIPVVGALALIPPTTAPVVGWGPVDAPQAAPQRSGLGHAPTLPQPPQLGATPPTRSPGPVAPSSALASLAAQAAPPAYPQQQVASPQQGFGGTQAIAGPIGAQAAAPVNMASPLPAAGVATPAPPVVQLAAAQVQARTKDLHGPRLVVLRDDGSEGTAFPLGTDIVDLGRRDGDILLHDDLYVSPRHARFRREGDRVRVIDLASTNGIYLRLRGQHRLTSGNLILLGLEVLQFQLVKDAAPPASPHAPSAAGPRGRGGAGAPAAGGAALAAPVQPFGGDFDAIEATWAGRGNPWSPGGRSPAAPSGTPGATPASPPLQGFGQASQHGTLVFGSPATSRRASLQQRTIEGIVRDVYHLVRDEVVLGREGADIVFSADPFMSRRHAVIRRDPATDVYTLVDLESSNGTFVRIENDAFLKHGDEIRIGRHLFRFDRETSGDGGGASAHDQASHV